MATMDNYTNLSNVIIYDRDTVIYFTPGREITCVTITLQQLIVQLVEGS